MKILFVVCCCLLRVVRNSTIKGLKDTTVQICILHMWLTTLCSYYRLLAQVMLVIVQGEAKCSYQLLGAIYSVSSLAITY